LTNPIFIDKIDKTIYIAVIERVGDLSFRRDLRTWWKREDNFLAEHGS